MLDMFLSPDRTGPWAVTSMDVIMMAIPHLSGKERTEAHMGALLENAGLKQIMFKNLETNFYYDITMGHKS